MLLYMKVWDWWRDTTMHQMLEEINALSNKYS
jgi:hypothetical protein